MNFPFQRRHSFGRDQESVRVRSEIRGHLGGVSIQRRNAVSGPSKIVPSCYIYLYLEREYCKVGKSAGALDREQWKISGADDAGSDLHAGSRVLLMVLRLT